MEELISKKIWALVILIILGILTFLLLKPILLSIILGLILAFIFTPLYNRLNSKIKSKNLSVFIICTFLILLLIIPIWFLTPIAINQSFKLYLFAQKTDFISPITNLLPQSFSSESLVSELRPIIQNFISKSIQELMTFFSNLILNSPKLLLHFSVVLFTFFFALRDNKELVLYIKTLMPFSENIKQRLFSASKGIATSVIYGQFIVGILQGVIVGISLFIFKVPNSLLLSLFSCILGVFPIIGVPLIWVPVVIYFLTIGNTFAAIGVLIFGVFASTIDNFIRPFIVSKKTEIPSSIILIGMIGGVFMFGILGLILGPLILAYSLVMIEIYRFRKTSDYIFINKHKS